MKTFKILAILTLFSFQAQATGYVHNMFVAHKKLQTGKELVGEKFTAGKAKATVKYVNPAMHAKPAISDSRLSHKMTESLTLNERILEEGPASFFGADKQEVVDKSVVSRLVNVLRNVVYTFICIPR